MSINFKSSSYYLDYIKALNEHSQCMEPKLEKLVDRLIFNKVYVEADLQKHCDKERQNVLNLRQQLREDLEKKSISSNSLNKI